MKLNLDRLKSIETTLEAIDRIERMLKSYCEDSPGPVYMIVETSDREQREPIQFSREHFREFMNQRKQQLIQHLEERFEGFEYDASASWQRGK